MSPSAWFLGSKLVAAKFGEAGSGNGESGLVYQKDWEVRELQALVVPQGVAVFP